MMAVAATVVSSNIETIDVSTAVLAVEIGSVAVTAGVAVAAAMVSVVLQTNSCLGTFQSYHYWYNAQSW